MLPFKRHRCKVRAPYDTLDRHTTLSLITIAQRHDTNARMDKHKHEECRAAKYSSIHATHIIRRAVVTHRWRNAARTCKYNATRTHRSAQVHVETVTQTPVHNVAIRAPAYMQCMCARRRMAWQLQLSISTMLAMAHILLTTRDTSVTTTVRKRAAHAICVRLRMRTPAESFSHAKYRRMHAACLR